MKEEICSTPNTFRQLWNDQYFNDVTLTTVYNCQINVHKVILSSCSQFFRNLHQKLLIYFKDIRHKEQEMILKFIYLHQCELGQGELLVFLNTGKELKINGLMDEMEMEKEEETYVPQKEQQPLDK